MKTLMMKATMIATMVLSVLPVQAQMHLVWMKSNGKWYWYENDQRQGVYGDPKNITDSIYGEERGREIYDPESDAWYWLDACYGGAKATDKEVWIPYIYQSDLKTGANPNGKWVRYNAEGKMIKGWYTPVGTDATLYRSQADNVYYYDLVTGEMAKGWKNIDGNSYHFNETTGRLDNFTASSANVAGLYDFIYYFTFPGHQDDYFCSSNPYIKYNSQSIVYSILYCPTFDYNVGPASYNYEDYSLPQNPDPLKRFNTNSGYWSYNKFDKNKVLWMAENVVNLSRADFYSLYNELEDKNLCYSYGDSYYSLAPGIGFDDYTTLLQITHVSKAGDVYVAEYRSGWHGETYDISRMVLQLKNYESKPYWSIISKDTLVRYR